jgi:hypothetical protein
LISLIATGSSTLLATSIAAGIEAPETCAARPVAAKSRTEVEKRIVKIIRF